MTADCNKSGNTGAAIPSLAEGTSADSPLATLFGNPGRLQMERAIAELRSGRPVGLVGPANRLVIAAAETLGGREIVRWRNASAAPVGLILPQPRLAYIGVSARGPGCLALDGLTAEAVDEILFATAPVLPPLQHRPATKTETLALSLVKHAYLLPAAIFLPDAVATGEQVFGVNPDAVATYHDRAAQELEIAARTHVPLSEAVEAEFVVFRGGDGQRDQVAIVVGRPEREPVPVRLHSACLTGDLFGSLKCDCGDQLRGAVELLSQAGGGVLLYLDQEGRGIGLRNKIRAYGLQDLGHDTLEADAALGYGADERRYLIAGRMLSLLGIARVVLLTNSPRRIAGLEQAGIEVVAHQRVLGRVNGHNLRYLQTKARAGHLLGKLPDDAGA